MISAPPGLIDAVDTPVLKRNDSIVGRLIRAAQECVDAGRYHSATEWAWIAARFSTTNPTLRVRNADLERAFDLVAVATLRPSGSTPAIPTGGRRVLHVLSEAYSIGGLSRLVQRWIQRDATSQSSVVVTRQDELVTALSAAAEASGGRGWALGEESDPISRAQALRDLADDADYVFCHLNPDDHVVALAFGEGYGGAPVAIFNHSDHMFLLAPTRASLIVDFRSVGSQFTTLARGYSPESMYTLPLLIPDAGTSRGARAHTRSVLGVSPDQVLALTLARAVKFADTPLRPRFSELVGRALGENLQLVVCAVGATEQEEPWATLARQFPGRVHAVGPTPDPQPYIDAADLYLDTFPFSSLTSLLEASASALPVLTFDGHDGLRRVLGITDFVATPDDRPADVESYLTRIAELADDPEARREAGVRARETFLALTPEQAWLDKLQGLYQALDRARAQGSHLGDTAPPLPDMAIAHHNLAILTMEVQTLLILYITGGLPRFDPRDRLRLRAKLLAVRAARKPATLSGRSYRTFEKLLLPLRSGVPTGSHSSAPMPQQRPRTAGESR